LAGRVYDRGGIAFDERVDALDAPDGQGIGFFGKDMTYQGVAGRAGGFGLSAEAAFIFRKECGPLRTV